jgi:hypothetical protein
MKIFDRINRMGKMGKREELTTDYADGTDIGLLNQLFISDIRVIRDGF